MKLFQFLVSKLEFSLVGICVRVALTCFLADKPAPSGGEWCEDFIFELVN